MKMTEIIENGLAPIILFTYARPEHTQKVLESLADNILAKESTLYIFCDAPKNDSVKEKNEAVKQIIKSSEVANAFAEINIICSDKNKGLARSIIGGVTKVIEKHGKCIVLEDDNITGKNFLVYMNRCLNEYENDRKIWSISGYTGNLKCLENYERDVYLSYRSCSTGWGTWKERWELVDWDVKDFKKLKKSPYLRYKFNRGGNDLYRMLRHQMRGERDSWAVRFCYAQSKNDMYTVYPRKSFIYNIGFDGTGVHCQNKQSKSNSQGIDTSGFDFGVVLDNISDAMFDKRIVREFKAQYRVTFLEALDWLMRKMRG